MPGRALRSVTASMATSGLGFVLARMKRSGQLVGGSYQCQAIPLLILKDSGVILLADVPYMGSKIHDSVPEKVMLVALAAVFELFKFAPS